MPRIEGLTFAERLRYLARCGQYGHACKPHQLHVSDSGPNDLWEPWSWRHRETGRCGTRILSEPTAFGHPEWQAFARFVRRYQKYFRFVTEVLPQWKTTKVIYYLDNSIEEIQTSVSGQTRRVMVLAPAGDACF